MRTCPFCGGEATTTREFWEGAAPAGSTFANAVGCPDCDVWIERDTEEEAIEVWNHRVGEVFAEIKVPKEELSEAIDKAIVRCKDCKHYVEDPDPIDPDWPMVCEDSGRDMLPPDGFCAWGERKDADE